MPWTMSRRAFLSGKFNKWIVQAEWTMYMAILHIWRRPCVRLYRRNNFDTAPAACVQYFRGDTCEGRGDVVRVYLRKGR